MSFKWSDSKTCKYCNSEMIEGYSDSDGGYSWTVYHCKCGSLCESLSDGTDKWKKNENDEDFEEDDNHGEKIEMGDIWFDIPGFN